MRAKVVAAKSEEICQGPGKFLIRNKTATAAIFLDVASVSEGGAAPNPPATEAEGYEWPSAGPSIEIRLSAEEALNGIVVAAGAEQVLHLLRTSPI